MIVSHRHRFIFIHCRKVAGSSMKVTLAPHLGRSDILLGSLHEILRDHPGPPAWALKEMVHPRGLLEIASTVSRGRNWRNALNKAVKKRYKHRLNLSSASHPPAPDVRAALPDAWAQYFKFCFVRNPYERAVSDYLYRTRHELEPPPFSDHLDGLLTQARSGKQKHDNWPMYTIDNHVAMDFVGRYETLHADFQQVTERIGLGGLQMTGSEKRRSYPKPWQAYYGDGDRERVEALYGAEIRHFGYAFEASE